MKDWKAKPDKALLRKYLGSMTQLAGLKRYELDEGRSKGVEAVDARTGAGLEYTVLPGRGMDIAWTSYRGVPISYMGKGDIAHPAYYEAEGLEWLRGFYAGMLTTCGFANVGGPCEEDHPIFGTRRFGLHGRLSYLPASEVSTREEWVDGNYEMSVSGKVAESIVHGERLTLRRTIMSRLGENRIYIRDVIENEGNRPQPIMLLYHMNAGYPMLDKNARLVLSSVGVRGADDIARREIDKYGVFHEPVLGQVERCYFHQMRPLNDGYARALVINDEMELGLSISFKPEQLPCLTEWKMLGEGEYVLGIEPGNTNPIGRAAAKENGTLETIDPGEQKQTEIIIEIMDGAEAIARAENEIGRRQA